MVETFREREPLSAPGFAFVTTAARWEPLPLSGGNVSSLIVMARSSPVATTAEPPLTEAATAEEQDPQKQWPWLQRRSAPLDSTRTGAQAEAVPAAPSFVKPKPKPVVREAREQWPWLQRRSALLVSTRAGG